MVDFKDRLQLDHCFLPRGGIVSSRGSPASKTGCHFTIREAGEEAFQGGTREGGFDGTEQLHEVGLGRGTWGPTILSFFGCLNREGP